MRGHFGASDAFSRDAASQPNMSYYGGSPYKERAKTANIPGTRTAIMCLNEKKMINE